MKKKVLSILLGTAGFFWGCYPNGPDYVEELDLVYTNYNEDFPFESKGTYARPDQIVKMTGDIVDGDEPVYVPDAVAAQILSKLDANMQANGWTLVDLEDNPDVAILPATIESTTIVYWYDWWYWWYGGYYPPGGWYPWYPYYPAASSYTTGTLLFAMGDTDELENKRVHWTFVANGVLTGAYDVNRINKAIDNGFKQSPYLKIN